MEAVKQYYPYMASDMQATYRYIIPGMALGAICGIIALLVYRLLKHKWNGWTAVAYFLFFTYAAVVVQIVYFSREPGTRSAVSMELWETWGTTLRAHAYVIENVIMFIPFGLLFPLLGKFARWHCMTVALGATVAIEVLQYVTQRGYCQLDDIVTNVCGAAIGYVIFLLCYGVYAGIHHLKKKTYDTEE